VYSTCLFCTSSLPRNDAIGHWPIGRRIAWDAERGRLWVICRRCARWNLSPLEERWEAIEELERLFSITPTRHTTGEIGLARAGGGVDLIRIGRPLRSEFAAWRFSDVFRSRYRREVVWGTGWIVLTGGLWIAGSSFAALSGGGGPLALALAAHHFRRRREFAPIGRFPDDSGESRVVRAADIHRASLIPDPASGWELRIPIGRSTVRLGATEASSVAPQLFAALNAAGARARVVSDAVADLERVGRPERYFDHAAGLLASRRIAPAVEHERFGVIHLPDHVRLGLEMAANEETERLLLDGELRLLHAAWREAEELAAIADRLVLPAAVERTLATLHPRRTSD
jgi:hypothetical protein